MKEIPNEVLAVNQAGRISKPVMTAHAELIVKNVLEGNLEPWKAIAYSKYLTDLAKQVREGVMPTALSEFTEPFSFEGITVKQKDTGVRYDYNSCNHPIYNKLSSEVTANLLKMKELEEMLIKVKEPFDMVDTESGEVIKVYPPKRTATPVIEISYNKK